MIKPEKVKKLNCQRCGELLVKIYPWARLMTGSLTFECTKCANDIQKKIKNKEFVRDLDRLGYRER